MVLGDVLSWNRSRHPALVSEGQTTSYRQLDEAANQFAHLLLRLGLVPGDRVSLLMSNEPLMLVAYFGMFKAGIVAQPLYGRLSPSELAFIIEHAQSRMIVTTGEHVHTLEEVRRLWGALPKILCFRPGSTGKLSLLDGALLASQPVSAPTDSGVDLETEALLIYTSGTTARPKGVVLTHRNLLVDAAALAESLDLPSRHRTLCFMPLSHCNALVFSHLASFLVGATVVLTPRFSASKHWDLVEAHRINSFSCPPTVLAILLERTKPTVRLPRQIKYIKVGSAPLPSELADRFESRFGQVLLEGYGLTEGTCTNTLNPIAGRRKRGSVGQPLPNHEMRVVDDAGQPLPRGEVGEVVIRGGTVMKGYFRDPAATKEAIVDGWLHTGDIGRADAEDYYYLVGRKKEMILRGGENISPQEIEEVLLRHPRVRDAAVIGVADAIWGEVVAAFVVGEGGISGEELRAFCRENLADFKTPQQITFVERLPRSETGKLQRQKVGAASEELVAKGSVDG